MPKHGSGFFLFAFLLAAAGFFAAACPHAFAQEAPAFPPPSREDGGEASIGFEAGRALVPRAETGAPPAVLCPPSRRPYDKGAPDQASRLESVRIVAGRPGDEDNPSPSDLAPAAGGKRGGRLVQIWPFEPEEAASGILLVCGYSAGAPLRFQLPASARRCEVSYKTAPWTKGAVPVGARCR